jgi:bleomycin hydrolase
MKIIILILSILFVTDTVIAQKYEFKPVIDIVTSDVKSQDNTGTCWSFSTSSFIESEVYRINGKTVDISEMFTVRKTYEDKAWNYVMRQGKIQFSQGGLAHDVINSIQNNGLVPEKVFSGLFVKKKYNHSKIVPQIKDVLDAYIKNDKDSNVPNWQESTSKILDAEIGSTPERFTYNGKKYSPKSFAKMLGINAKDYVTMTSFSHKPYYNNFVLNIPDNFSNGSMFNLPIDELTKLTIKAVKKGYSIALDIDVSEKTFSAKNGIAVIPSNKKDNEKSMTELVSEMNITQEYRQTEFENFNTTDDHLMHIVGLLKDQKGNTYFKVKNSWGSNSKRIGNSGFIYMSMPYFKLKVISVLLNKEGVSKKYLKKMSL